MTRGGLDVRAMQRRITRTAERPSQNARRRSAQSRPGHLRQAKNRRDSQRQSGAWVHGGRARRASEASKGASPRANAITRAKEDGRRGPTVEAGSPERWRLPVKARCGRRALQGKQTSREASGWSSLHLAASLARRVENGEAHPPDRRSQLDPQCPCLLRIPRNRMQGGRGPVRRSARRRPRTTPLN